MKDLLRSGILLLASTFLLLLSPPPTTPKEDACGAYVRLTGSMGFWMGCDTSSYLLPAEHPAMLLEKGAIRQSRPLYILVGHALGRVLSTLIQKDGPTQFYAAFLAINYAILLSVVLLSHHILAPTGVPWHLRWAVAFMLVWNPTVKDNLWGATPTLFSIFMPLYALVVADRLARSHFKPPVRTAVAMLSQGLWLLVYGNFLLLVAPITSAWSSTMRPRDPCFRRRVAGMLVGLGAFFLPTLLWILALSLLGVRYTNSEVKVFREFVWIADAISGGEGAIRAAFADNSAKFLTTLFSWQILPLLAAMMALVIVTSRRRDQSPETVTSTRSTSQRTERLAMILLAACAVFFWLLGYYAVRLSFTLVPPLLLVIALELNAWSERSPTVQRVLPALTGAVVFWWCLATFFEAPAA